MSMNQIDLFPYLIDQLVVDNYRVALSELKRLREAKAERIEGRKAYKRTKRDQKRIIDASTERQFERRRLLKKFEANENDIQQEFKDIDLYIKNGKKDWIQQSLQSMIHGVAIKNHFDFLPA